MQTLTTNEITEVSGGVLPLALYGAYTAISFAGGYGAGVAIRRLIY